MLKREKIILIILVVLSFVAYLCSNGQMYLPILSWIYPIMFLATVSTNYSIKRCSLVFSIYLIGFILQFVNVLGMGLLLCVLVSVIIAVMKTIPYIFWVKSKRDFKATVMFAAIMTIMEYLIYCVYPIIGGLSDSYTQYNNKILLQITTITGIFGITFIIFWTAAIAIWVLERKNRLGQYKKNIFIYVGVMCLLFLYGTFMINMTDSEAKSIRIAAVTVPVSDFLNNDEDVYNVFYTNSFSNENRENARKKLSDITNELLLKTIQEAQAGAKIVFWSELNGAVLKEDEEILLERAKNTAKEQQIYLMVSLLVKTPYENLKENKVVVFDPQGEVLAEYLKHGKSLGELCIAGDGQMKSFDTEYERMAPFICSDMAFTSEIWQAGRGDVDTLLVPASDWAEMTEIAIRTAVVRGVENGCNIIRHTNRGISIATDYYGNILGISNYFKSDNKSFVAEVPTSGRFTLYPYIGNAFVLLCAFFIIKNILSHLIKFLHSK